MKTAATATPNLRLRHAREEKGWSQEQVAEQLSTSAFTICRWERGFTFPSPHYRQKLCALFQDTPAALGLLPAEEQHRTAPRGSPPSPAQSAPPDLSLAIPALPAPPPLRAGLVGRDEPLRALKQQLCEGTRIALSGLPGIGKTTLAAELAHDPAVLAQFPDGVLWAGLGPTPGVLALLGGWGLALGLSTADLARLPTIAELGKALRALIGMRRMFLVIDDAWQIEEALAFKIGGPRCAHLVTTRAPELAAQFAHEGTLTIHELSEEDGIALLTRLAPVVVTYDPEQARALVQAVGGLPLGLTLLGQYLQVQTLSGQPRRIRAALEHLQRTEDRLRLSHPYAPSDGPPGLSAGTPLSLQAMIAISDQAINQEARAALRALALFPPKPNTFSEEAALAVSGAPVEALDTLLGAGLLESRGAGRYTLHQTIADYGRLQQGAHKERIAAEKRLVEYVVSYIEEQQTAYPALEQEAPVLLAGLQVAADQRLDPLLVRGATALAPFLVARGLYEIATTHLTQAQEAARRLGDRLGRIQTALHLGWVAEHRGNYPQAHAHAQGGLNLARQVGESSSISRLLHLLGVVTIKQGEMEQAEAYLQEGLALARQVGEYEQISALLLHLGSLADRRGEIEQAEAYLREGLALARQVSHPEHISALLQGLGTIAGKREDYEAATTSFLDGLALARQIGHRERVCAILTNLGVVALNQGHNTQAEAYLQEGLSLAHQIGHPERICGLLANLGATAANCRQYARAENYLREGLLLAREIGHRERMCAILINLSAVILAQDHDEHSEEYIQEGLTLAREMKHRRHISAFLHVWGELCLKREQPTLAKPAFQEALVIGREIQSQELMAIALHGLGQVAAALGNVREAYSLGQESLTLFESIGHYQATAVEKWLTTLPAIHVASTHGKGRLTDRV